MIFAKTRVANAKVRASASPLFKYNASKKTTKTTIKMLPPCKRLKMKFFLLNKGSVNKRGALFIISFSSGSASKTVEQAGSMMSSRNAICAGNRTIGRLNNTGKRDIPAIGI